VDLGYARVSTAKQDLDRQLHALGEVGIAAERRRGRHRGAHPGDRLGRTVRDTLNLIHDLSARGVGVRNLADPIRIDSSNPEDPMAQLAVVLLALFGQMERTYTLERAAHARAVATAKGRRIGRSSVVEPHKLAYAAHLREAGDSIAEIVAKTGITRSSLYRHLPPRPADTVTAAGTQPERR
jgi:DNA invertase Pin-like site-specific DNA recombinase